MTPKRKIAIATTVLVVLHLAVVLAGFLAPYDPATQTRSLPYAPPTAIHFFDSEGYFSLRPFVYGLTNDPTDPRRYLQNRSRKYPLRWFARGETYSLGGIETDLHLVTVDEPGRLFLLGSDAFGRDVFSRLLHGGRISLLAGLIAATLSVLLGTSLGSLSGFYGRWVDTLVMRSSELFMTLPWLYVLLAVRALLPLSISPAQAFLLLIILLGSIGWARPARLVRGVVLRARNESFVEAARGLGAGDPRILVLHILPQTASVVLTQAALLIPQYILAEVTLSYLGVGITEPTPSWGTMLASLRNYAVLAGSYWWLFSPGVALVVVFVAYHALSRALQSLTPA